MLDLSGYKLTFDDEFNTRSISWSWCWTKWAGCPRRVADGGGKADIGFGRSSFVDPSSGYDPFSVKEVQPALHHRRSRSHPAAGFPAAESRA